MVLLTPGPPWAASIAVALAFLEVVPGVGEERCPNPASNS